VVGGGPDPGLGFPVIILRYDGNALTPLLSFDAMPPGYTSGANVAAGRFGSGFLPLHI